MTPLVFVHEINNRLVYAFDIIFKYVLKSGYRFTTDKEEYLNYEGAKFVYRKTPLDKGLFFYSADLLFEKNIRPQHIMVDEWNNMKIIFANKNYGQLPFDPFSAAFYLVTRYEEYTSLNKDSHGRFQPTNSLAQRNNFLHIPLINIYATEVKNTLLQFFPQLYFPNLTYTFYPTLDIDNAYAYKNKSFFRVLPGILMTLLRFKIKRFVLKTNVYFGNEPDPYDTYDKQDEINQKYGLRPTYFFLLGDYGKFDRNLSYTNPHLRKLISKIAARYDVGIHPSYRSNRVPSLVEKEKNRLEDITGQSVTKSRQHYLKLKFPDTYQNLLKAGIKEDYSMGYSTELGFRASICNPFYFYDISKEEITPLMVYPFCIMDSTLKFHLKVRSNEVIYQVKPYIDAVKAVKGQFMMVFHNESFGTHKIWRNWGDVYENIVHMAKAK